MLSFVRKAACGLTVTALLATAGTALADPPSATYTEKKGTDGQDVFFDADALGAGAMAPNEALLKVRRSATRMMLLRPRTQFVTEMLKTVENL